MVMTSAHRTRRVLATAVLATACLGLGLPLGSPASAAPATAQASSGNPFGGGGNGRRVGNCYVVASPRYLGFSCGGSGSNDINVKEILGKNGDEHPCWNVALTDSELKAVGHENTDDYTYYWEFCVTDGISIEANIFKPRIRTSLVRLFKGQEPKTLTSKLARYLEPYGSYGAVPEPIVGTSPSDHPRVNTPVSFYDLNKRPDVTIVDPRVAGVKLVASVASTRVYPYGQDPGQYGETGSDYTCDGFGYVAKRGETERDHPNSKGGCWFTYDRASYDAGSEAVGDEGRFAAKMETHWNVKLVTPDGTFSPPDLNFDKPGTSNIQVTQVKALVVR